jgi:hypothetical protein
MPGKLYLWRSDDLIHQLKYNLCVANIATAKSVLPSNVIKWLTFCKQYAAVLLYSDMVWFE